MPCPSIDGVEPHEIVNIQPFLTNKNANLMPFTCPPVSDMEVVSPFRTYNSAVLRAGTDSEKGPYLRHG